MAGKTRKSRKPVLLVQHAPHEHPAAIRRALHTQGIPSLWVRLHENQPLPSAEDIAGIVSLGGPMGANDEKIHPWIADELRLLKKAISRELPVAGICLGAQLMAKAMGAKVSRNPVAEVGWFSIQLTSKGKEDPVLGVVGDSPTVYQWHYDTFEIPQGAELLASSEACARQAFRLGKSAYGFQFHPEADHQLIHEWLGFAGVEEDILHAREIHGPATIQEAEIQRQRAAQEERTSLQITVSMTQLFRSESYEPGAPQGRERLVTLLESGALITIEFHSPGDKAHRIEGRILTILSLPTGEFVVLRDSDGLLWPIRMDDVRKIKR